MENEDMDVMGRMRVREASSRARRRFAAIAVAGVLGASVLFSAPAVAAAAPTGTIAGAHDPAGARGKSSLLAWSSPEGVSRLGRARNKQAFALLANHFEPQQNKFYCGPASATVVLNALRLGVERFPKPEDRRQFDPAATRYLPPGYDPVFARYTQDTFFTPSTDAVKTRLQVLGEPRPGSTARDYGLQLRELDGMLRAHGLSTTMRVVGDETSSSRARDELSGALDESGTFVIVNYQRRVLGQPGGGHISPLGAYDAVSDSFLIMDVNPNAGPWVWVPSDVLVAAMRTHDLRENRGYIVVHESKAPPGAPRRSAKTGQ